MLRGDDLEEEDAELILAVMRDNSADVLEYIPGFLQRFPNLSKNIFHFCRHVEDTSALAFLVGEYLDDAEHLTEFQLFWIGKVIEEFLLDAPNVSELIGTLFEHPNATSISKAKILEIPDARYGLNELREEHLRTGASGWLPWSAAVGLRSEQKRTRNHLLSYFANGSKVNEVIASCIKSI